jgi:hypothetical protein
MSAIRRVLSSISGKNLEAFPQIEVILEQTLAVTLTEVGSSQVEDGIACIAEILYNQQQISPRMWNFYETIVNVIVQDRGILDEFLV